MINDSDLLLDVVAYDENGNELHPFLGVQGSKKGKFSANLESENAGNFAGYSEAELRNLIESGQFDTRGRIRMVTRSAAKRSSAGAYAPVLYKGSRIRR